ncbi:MAG: hypothetical protein ACREKH_01540, partial [Candidatus Rokuibacteriota bacterium]
SGVSFNCDPTAPTMVTVAVPSGGTTSVSFDVTCTAARQLAFSNGDIQLIWTNAAGLTPLAPHAESDAVPSWSPDGSRIAFQSWRHGNAEIYVMNADGSGVTRLTSHGALDQLPSWSPDGSTIAFTSERDGNAEIYLINPDGAGLTRLTNHPANPDTDPAWSPDGSRIAFRRDTGIHVMNADGSGAMPLTSGQPGMWDERPVWSPDGTRIAFARIVACDYYYCQRDLFVMNADGSGLVPLTSGPDDHGDPAWSPDGAWIAFNASPCDYYYGCYQWSLRAVRSNGTDARELGVAGFHAAWRP